MIHLSVSQQFLRCQENRQVQELQAQEAAEAIWDQIQELVQEIWADVFGKANKILTARPGRFCNGAVWVL